MFDQIGPRRNTLVKLVTVLANPGVDIVEVWEVSQAVKDTKDRPPQLGRCCKSRSAVETPLTAPYSCIGARDRGAAAEPPWTAPYSCRGARGRDAAAETPLTATYSSRGAGG